MELLVVALALGLVAALSWAITLHRHQHTPAPAAAPAADPLRALFDAAVASIDAGLIILDSERRIRYLNPQSEDLLGIAAPAPLGQGLIAVLRDYQVDSLAIDVLQDGEVRELVLQPAGGRTLRIRATRYVGEGATGVVLLIRDTTQLNMLERARRDMVANVSHELRTPLASVKLLVETLQTEPPPPIAQRMLSQMEYEIDAVTQLVNELHELSQIESGRVALQLSPTRLADVVDRAIERIRPQAERKSLQLAATVAPDLPLALLDADRVGQVLLNLLHNAVKFSAERGVITIAAAPISVSADPQHAAQHGSRPHSGAASDAVERRGTPQPIVISGGATVQIPAGHAIGEWMLVWISDSGVGIPANDLPRIFERFYKVDRARTRNAGGTGLGLAIAKHLVEGHGGQIWATSREGGGSTFYLTLLIV
jgi:two-component system, OmpR family, phosphate regulon sensor histidine kinase PhoR